MAKDFPPKPRDKGFYWVRYDAASQGWEVAQWLEVHGEHIWNRTGEERDYDDHNFAEIGPRAYEPKVTPERECVFCEQPFSVCEKDPECGIMDSEDK